MTEQEKREKVIKGLECCAFSNRADKCEQCPYFSGCETEYGAFVELARDALDLLKAQEARVMTLDDLNQCKKETIWAEIKHDNALKQLTQDEIAMLTFIGLLCHWNGYNTTWRCWTSRPDENRRAETPWNL
jgi:hypothetical protein